VVPSSTEVARSERFELPTLGIEIRCSIQLSYERIGRRNAERVWLRANAVGGVTVEVFAFGSEFFNTRSRVPGRPSAQSGFLAGVLAGGCSAAFFIDRK
jgi:hypothetical protein